MYSGMDPAMHLAKAHSDPSHVRAFIHRRTKSNTLANHMDMDVAAAHDQEVGTTSCDGAVPGMYALIISTESIDDHAVSASISDRFGACHFFPSCAM